LFFFLKKQRKKKSRNINGKKKIILSRPSDIAPFSDVDEVGVGVNNERLKSRKKHGVQAPVGGDFSGLGVLEDLVNGGDMVWGSSAASSDHVNKVRVGKAFLFDRRVVI